MAGTDHLDGVSLDDLIAACTRHDADPDVAKLLSLLRSWKDDSSDIAALTDRVERLFGNAWIASEAVHSELYEAWARFKREAIETVGGQTMNERLYWFSLFERFDACRTDDERDALYAKLLASR